MQVPADNHTEQQGAVGILVIPAAKRLRKEDWAATRTTPASSAIPETWLNAEKSAP